MTKAIPVGTVNISINVPKEEAAILGRLAFGEDRSRGSFLRRAWLDYVQANYPNDALTIEVARKTLKACGMFTAGIWVVWLAAFGQMDTERRAARLRPSHPRVVRVRAPRLKTEVVA